MPTGYTCIIEDKPDVTFAEYVWRCARAFGALLSMREDSLDAPIPDELKSEDTDYYKTAYEKAKQETVKELDSLAKSNEWLMQLRRSVPPSSKKPYSRV
jgi:hypothetical protein